MTTTDAAPTRTTAVTTKKDNPLTVIHADIQQREDQFAAALPAHIPTAKFMRVVLTAIANSKDLQTCTRKSIINECMKAAADGLVLDGREAVLIKFGVNVGTKTAPKYEDQAKYIPMVQGLMKKARNSGEVASLSPVVVYKNDNFEYHPHLHDVPQHEIDWFEENGPRGEPIGAYAVVYLKDAEAKPIVQVLSKAQIMKIAGKTKNKYQYDPASGESWEEWWKKCAIRRVSKYAPASTDKEGTSFAETVTRDDDMYEGDDEAPTTAPEKPRKQRRAAQILGGEQPAQGVTEATVVTDDADAERGESPDERPTEGGQGGGDLI